jgi:hypothetical protein
MNGTVNIFRKRWDSLMEWVTAMDYSTFDYTNDRIRRLEHEVKRLNDELRRTRISSGTPDGGSDASAQARET